MEFPDTPDDVANNLDDPETRRGRAEARYRELVAMADQKFERVPDNSRLYTFEEHTDLIDIYSSLIDTAESMGRGTWESTR